MKHVIGALLLGLGSVWLSAYTTSLCSSQWWCVPAQTTICVCLLVAVFWLAVGIADFLAG